MELRKSIAIIGEGETEWFYFDSLRTACRYPFKIAPQIPQHSDIPHIVKLAQLYVSKDYDFVVCLIDMDRLLSHPAEMDVYRQAKAKSGPNIIWIETNPCTEFWFLLHFMPELSTKCYETCDDVITDLQKYMPGYEKTSRYFQRAKLYEYLRDNGDINRAIKHAEKLSQLCETSCGDRFAYSQIYKVIKLLNEWSIDTTSKNGFKNDFPKPIGDVESRIVDFLSSSPDSDLKMISRAIGLKASRTTDYLKRLLEKGFIECSNAWRKTYRVKNNRYQ